MAQRKGGKRQHGLSRMITQELEGNLGKTITLERLMKLLRATPIQVQGTISYIKNRQAKEQNDDWRLVTVKRGKAWRAVSVEEDPATDKKVTMKLRETRVVPQEQIVPVPASEPEAIFQILGTVKETGELILRGTSAGVGGTWLARSL